MKFTKIDLSKSELQQSEMNKVLGGYKVTTRSPGQTNGTDYIEVTVGPDGTKSYGDIQYS